MQEIVAMQGLRIRQPRSVIQDQDLGLLVEGADYLQPLLLGSDKASTAERANPGHASVSFAHYPLTAPRSQRSKRPEGTELKRTPTGANERQERLVRQNRVAFCVGR